MDKKICFAFSTRNQTYDDYILINNTNNESTRCGGKAINLYSGGDRFESWTEHRPSCLEILLGFPQYFKVNADIIPRLGNENLPNPFQFIINQLHYYVTHCILGHF
jgi:hypothetical protein